MELQLDRLRARLVEQVAYSLLEIVNQHVHEHGWNSLAIKDGLMLLKEIKECKTILGEDITDTVKMMEKLEEAAV